MKNALSPGIVVNGKTPGRYFDGQGTGLFLLIRDNGGKQWKQRVTIKGRKRELGLGSPPAIPLTKAREIAFKNKQALMEGRDLVAERRKERLATIFSELAYQRHNNLKDTWRNPKHGVQWISTLERYAFPHIGNLDVAAITPDDIEKILLQKTGKDGDEVFWQAKAETARRVRQRMEDIFKWAAAKGLRLDNPVTNIKIVMPKQKAKPKPHRSIPYEEVAAAITTVRNSQCLPKTALAFEWLILTASRSGEMRGAVWGEIDLENALWTIPGGRMKASKDHRVPLSSRCMEILRQLLAEYKEKAPDADSLLFDSLRGKKISDATISKLLRDHGIDAVPHGFRTSFRVWVQEQTNVPSAVAEAALAHTNPNKVEAAYARSDYLDKRRVLMQQWADYLGGSTIPE